MDTYEATKVVMSRVQALDSENASKIMGYILIQDQGEKEMIRLAFVPESLLLSFINQAKVRLGILSNPFPRTTPRISIPSSEFHLSNPSSPLQRNSQSPSPRPFSYAAALNVGNNSPNNASSLHFYGSEFGNGGGGVPDPTSFRDDSVVDPVMSPSGRSDSLVLDVNGVPSPHYHPFHRRSCSVNDAAFLEGGGGGFGWRPCMYFARGFCKNGSACKFVHGEEEMGSPSKNGFEELLRMKVLQHQRLAALASRGHQPFDYGKCMEFLTENPRNEFSPMGLGGSSSSRQIYLTFPADSSFKEDDVSNYFSMFGPVQDVRIPYQQKRMFGFVTFIYPETVKLILAKGNPHFVCDSRVLVKPYKEKGKVPEKKQQQQHNLDLSPSGIDSMEHMDHHPFGTRMLFSSQEMMLKRKIEQEAELHHAIQLEGRRMMNLQLMDLKNQSHNQHLLQSFRAGIPFSSPRQSQQVMDRNLVAASDGLNLENSEDLDGRHEATKTLGIAADEKLMREGMQYPKQQNVNGDDSDPPESFLPDNLFASPTKLSAERQSIFSQVDDNIPSTVASSNNNTPTLPGMASLKSCYIQMPRFSSGQEAIEM